MRKIFEDDLFFIRDDVKCGIVIDGDSRYSVFSKSPYRRLIVYNGTEEWAIQQFWFNYDKFVKELEDE